MSGKSSKKGNQSVNNTPEKNNIPENKLHKSETGNRSADNTLKNKQHDNKTDVGNTSEHENLFKHIAKVVSSGNITRVAVTVVSLMLLGPVVGVGVGLLAFADAQCNISGKLKDSFSHKEREKGEQKDRQGKHTTLLGNALRIGLTVAAVLLVGPIAGILMGFVALLDYQLDGALSEKVKKMVVNLSKNIKETVSHVMEDMKEPVQKFGEHATGLQKTQERQEAGERESKRTGPQEGIQSQKELFGSYTAYETQRRNNSDTESLVR